MQIMTSYFASKAPVDRKVCISKKCPENCGLPEFKAFAPLEPWAKGDWRARYRQEILTRFPTPAALLRALEEVNAIVSNPILCCYEKNPTDCHRRVLAEIVREQLGMDIPEWHGPRQLSMFD